MVSPELFHIALQSGAERAEVVEARNLTVDFEGRGDKELAFE